MDQLKRIIAVIFIFLISFFSLGAEELKPSQTFENALVPGLQGGFYCSVILFSITEASSDLTSTIALTNREKRPA